MTPLLAFKLLLTPLFIGGVSLAGRRWGPAASGLLMGLPLTSGPVSVFLALQYGPAFAARAAAGNLGGQAAVCLFCLTYGLASRRLPWFLCAPSALLAFVAATALLNRFTWALGPAALLVLAAALGVTWVLPRRAVAVAAAVPPRWDLPARMVVATLFVLGLTTAARALGPQLSGLVAPFPIYGVVLAVFTHVHQGPRAAAQLARGNALGSLAFVAFFVTAGLALGRLPLGAAYLLAALGSLATGALAWVLTRPGQGKYRQLEM